MARFSKIVMTGSATLYLILGLGISFFPEVTGRILGTASQSGLDLLLMKVVGALLFGFGVINLMARNSAIGGIYGRAIVLGNIMIALITGSQFLKYIISANEIEPHFWAITILFLLLFVSFLKLFFTPPVEQ
ncbi:MAG: hypothetical protein WD357_04795 [Gracilimonas sp.]